jgi:ribonuclease III
VNDAGAGLQRRLGYRFRDPDLLERALTHRSRSGANYERLEFLGDSVLGFVVSAELYRRYPDLTEGELTRLRASLVRKPSLAALARQLDLGGSLQLGEGELKSGGHDRDSTLADSLEAIFGAVFLDGGVEAAARTILALYAEPFGRLDPTTIPKDPKTQLQELLQKISLPTPVYEVLEISGEPHQQHFVVECRVVALARAVRGEGDTRRAAEQQAAATALELLARQ